MISSPLKLAWSITPFSAYTPPLLVLLPPGKKGEGEMKYPSFNRFLCLAFLCSFLPLVPLGCYPLKLFQTPTEETQKSAKEQTPSKYSLTIAPFVLHSDFELKRKLPIFDELAHLRNLVYKELELPVTNTVVDVYVFDNRDHYERFMRTHYPDLPRRRAFFVAQAREVGGPEALLVYTYWGDRVGEDLRHELTHGLLHSVIKDVPLWLDEGLAENFELPSGKQGVNDHHLDQIRRSAGGPFSPDLMRWNTWRRWNR